jgi:hypothetical protein
MKDNTKELEINNNTFFVYILCITEKAKDEELLFVILLVLSFNRV